MARGHHGEGSVAFVNRAEASEAQLVLNVLLSPSREGFEVHGGEDNSGRNAGQKGAVCRRFKRKEDPLTASQRVVDESQFQI